MADTAEGQKPHVTPRELELDEIPDLIAQFQGGAKNALEAGFDGVEIHSANGYLLDLFLQNNSNQREDEYGGSIAGRSRFLLEITQAVVDVWGQLLPQEATTATRVKQSYKTIMPILLPMVVYFLPIPIYPNASPSMLLSINTIATLFIPVEKKATPIIQF
jgi:hypothetical protein